MQLQRPEINIRDAVFPSEAETIRLLLREYAAHLNSSSGVEHICLHSFAEELAGLPGVYAPPQGAVFLARVDGEPAGCVALKPIKPIVTKDASERACEMKRLWVRPKFRGMRLGTLLAGALIEYATARNYTALYLDTLPSIMQPANHIYSQLGFEPVERYRERLTFTVAEGGPPVEVAFFRLDLSAI